MFSRFQERDTREQRKCALYQLPFETKKIRIYRRWNSTTFLVNKMLVITAWTAVSLFNCGPKLGR